MPKTFTELVPPRYAGGPVVIINTHLSRCDALVVYGSAEPIVHVPLPDLTLELLRGMWLCFAQALNVAGVRRHKYAGSGVGHGNSESLDDPGRGAINPRRYANRRGLILIVLEVLWRTVVQPILTAIESEVA